jgi:hypothetical protein
MWFYMYSERAPSGADDHFVRSPACGWCRHWSGCTLGVLTLLGGVTLGGCEDPFAHRSDRAGVWRGYPRGERQGVGDFPRHHRHGRAGAEDRDSGADGGSDAGDAGLTLGASADASAAASSGAGAGLVDAGNPSADAVLDPTVQALSDGQILLVVDTLLGGSIDQASAALPRLVDSDVLGYAGQIVDEDGSARDTLATVAGVIGASPAESAVAENERAAIQGELTPLVEPDAGTLDNVFIAAQITALTRTLPLIEQLAAAADAPVLRAQLVVLHAVEQARLERATQIAAGL